MQQSAALRLREKWGDKPCDHPDYEKEYYLESHTGDYVCTQCGETFSSVPPKGANNTTRKTDQEEPSK